MTRRALGAFCLMCCASVSCADREAPRPTHVVLITVDTLRADRLGVYGYDRDTTPNADALAATGVTFLETIAPIPETLPSMTSMLTSTYPIDHGVRQNGYELPGIPLLAELLGAHGYASAAFTSSIVLHPQSGIYRGFDHYDVDARDPFLLWDSGQRSAAATTDAAIAWLDRKTRGRTEGLFLWVHYIDPHSIYAPPPPYDTRFRDPSYAGPVTGDVDQFTQILANRLRLDEADMLYMIGGYDGEVAYADFHVGRLIDRVRELLGDETLIVFTSDHGESLGEHLYMFDHGDYLFDDQIKVPLILTHPRFPRGKTVEGQVEIVDIVPTILDLLGIDAEPGMRGRSLLPLIDGEPAGVTYALSESDTCKSQHSVRPCAPEGIEGKAYSLRSGRFKLIVDPIAPPMLFDLDADPGETVNRLSAHPDVARALGARLRVLLAGDRGAVDQQQLDRETTERLRALGYVE